MKCKICKKREASDVHHKDGNHKNNKPDNLQKICTICHASLHGMSPKKSELKKVVILRDRAIRIRNSLDNQIRGFGRIEYMIPKYWQEERKTWDNKIKGFEKEMKGMIKANGYTIWDWMEKVKGISYITGAKIISYIDIGNTPSISALWRYCGLDATHIKRTKKISQEEALKFGKPYLKKEMMGILADNFIRQRTPIYRKMYDDEKERQSKRVDENKPKNKMHAHLRAKRKMVKLFLSHLWQKWREMEGLPVSEPYCVAMLKHKHKIEPEEVAT